MSILQLKKELEELKGALKKEHPEALVIIYDSKHREGEKIDLDIIVEINGKDVTELSNAEKEEILSKSHIHFYLPEKDPDPH